MRRWETDVRPVRIEEAERAGTCRGDRRRGEAFAVQLQRHRQRVVRRGQAPVQDRRPLEHPAGQHRLQPPPHGLHLGQLGHQSNGVARQLGAVLARLSRRNTVAPTSANVSPSWRPPFSGAPPPGRSAARSPRVVGGGRWSDRSVIGGQDEQVAVDRRQQRRAARRRTPPTRRRTHRVDPVAPDHVRLDQVHEDELSAVDLAHQRRGDRDSLCVGPVVVEESMS